MSAVAFSISAHSVIAVTFTALMGVMTKRVGSIVASRSGGTREASKEGARLHAGSRVSDASGQKM